MEACKCGTCMTCLFGEPISVYSRARALEDGALVDAGPMALEAGFTIPVALTRAVWSNFVEVPQGVIGQDDAGRLWDILSMLRFAIQANGARSEIRFRLIAVNLTSAGFEGGAGTGLAKWLQMPVWTAFSDRHARALPQRLPPRILEPVDDASATCRARMTCVGSELS